MPCAHINVNTLVDCPCSVLSVALSSSSLSTFSVVCSDRSEVDDKAPQGLKLVVFNMNLMSTCFEELDVLSKKLSVFTGIVDYMESTLKQVSGMPNCLVQKYLKTKIGNGDKLICR